MILSLSVGRPLTLIFISGIHVSRVLVANSAGTGNPHACKLAVGDVHQCNERSRIDFSVPHSINLQDVSQRKPLRFNRRIHHRTSCHQTFCPPIGLFFDQISICTKNQWINTGRCVNHQTVIPERKGVTDVPNTIWNRRLKLVRKLFFCWFLQKKSN